MINIFIYFSVIICASTNILGALIILRRDSKSNEHRFFALFLIGLAGFVTFYLFLQDPVLKDFSYFFQIFSASIAELGLFVFYYSLQNEGKVSKPVLLLCSIIFSIPPIFVVTLHPYSFLEESYGFELIIDPWFMLLVSIIYISFFLAAILGLLVIRLQTQDIIIKRKLTLIFMGLFLAIFAAVIFFNIVPVFFNIHYLKPIGYGLITIAIIIVVYAFKGPQKKGGL